MTDRQPLLPTTAAQEGKPGKAEDDHTVHVIGRRRRASEITRLIGHFHLIRDKPVLIAAIVLLEGNPGIDILRRTVLERVTQVPRFRSKLVLNRKKGGYFEEVEIDVGYHFEVFGFGRKVSRQELNEFVNQTQYWPLDFSKPLWKIVHVPELLETGGSAVVFVVHHAIGDGVSLVDVLLGLVDDSDQLKKDVRVSKRQKAPKLSFYQRTNAFMKGINEGFTITLWRPDAVNPLKFKGTCGKDKAVAASSGKIELPQVKQVCRAFDQEHVSVNDVILATLTKSLAMYFKDHCAMDPAKKKIRAQFPVNMRKPSDPIRNKHGDPYNNFAYGLFPLPIDAHEDSRALVLRIKREVDLIKHSPAAKIARSGLPMQVKTAPLSLILNLMDNLNNIATCTISNVPGPQHQVSIAGAPITVSVVYVITDSAWN